ncbi:MAG: radical SAM protein, partial [Acidobacteria bacterium]|nr:radical SAM protein [Acidobacteriota bacterium]
ENRPLIEDMDELPMPAKDILKDNKFKTAQISSSRGCLSRCSFCVSSLFWQKWRGKKVDNVLAEIEYVVENFGIRAFNFCDASFEDPGHHYERMAGIARGIIDRRLNISYFADIRAEFQRKASAELMQLLKDSGLCGVCVGIEAANQPDLKLYGKIAAVEDNFKFIELFRRYDINVDPGFINFNPYSNFAGLYQNIQFLEKYDYASNFDYIGSKFNMFKGTRLYLKVKQEHLLESPDYSESGYCFADRRIESLYKYIEAYLQKIELETNFALNRLSYYTCSYFNFLFHLKRQFLLNHEDEGYQTTVSSQETHRALLKPVNSRVSEWFKALLLLAEKGWHEEKSAGISEQLLSIEYVNKTITALEKNKIKLYKKLISLQLESYIIEVR